MIPIDEWLNAPAKIDVYPFESITQNPLLALSSTMEQAEYLVQYLRELKPKTVIHEGNYFDRDYLSEHKAYYSQVALGYRNVSQRLHFFKTEFDKSYFQQALEENPEIIQQLQEGYLGFIVIRPIPAPLGRSVVAWYDDKNEDNTRRVYGGKRTYTSHIAGIQLTIDGLAWQQQDTAVGCCATIALWEILHSSALDEFHAISTTADITQTANTPISSTGRIFPSESFTIEQIRETIRNNNLSPLVFDGDIAPSGQVMGFSGERFCGLCGSLIRSGYPALIVCGVPNATVGHAVVAVGFREPLPLSNTPLSLLDSNIKYIYIHDDSKGPNIRFQVDREQVARGVDRILLKPKAPSYISQPCELFRDYSLIPQQLIIAVHNDLRIPTQKLIRQMGAIAVSYADNAQQLTSSSKRSPINLTYGFQFIRTSKYLKEELKNRLGEGPILARVRQQLSEDVPPLSLYLGLVRLADGKHSLLDIIYDTTDNIYNPLAEKTKMPVFANLAYIREAEVIAEKIRDTYIDIGPTLCAF